MVDLQRIQSKIYEIRGHKVMINRDLAELYQVTTGNLNKSVQRNIKRFPSDFMFQLTKEEFDQLKINLIFQNEYQIGEVPVNSPMPSPNKDQPCFPVYQTRIQPYR